MKSSTFFLVIASAFMLLGCDPSHALAIDNRTSEPFVVRVTETTYAEDQGSSITYYEVGPNTNRYLFPPEIGPLTGTVDVLNPDCNPVGQISARNGSVITIAADHSLALDYLGSNDNTEGQFPTSTRCH